MTSPYAPARAFSPAQEEPDDRHATYAPARAFSQILLDVLPYQVTRRTTDELLHRTSIDAAQDMVTRDLVLTMRKELLAHRVQVDDADVPVTGRLTFAPARDVLVELPRTWWRRLLRRPPARVWVPLGQEVEHRPVDTVTVQLNGRDITCPVVGQAAAACSDQHADVRGTARVRADYFRTFPAASIRYPDDLGPIVTQVTAGDPYGWTPEP